MAAGNDAVFPGEITAIPGFVKCSPRLQNALTPQVCARLSPRAKGYLGTPWTRDADFAASNAYFEPLYLIALRQSCRHGDRAALAYAFVAFALKPVGTIEQMTVSRLANFSFDRYPLFTPVSKKSHPSCTTRATTAGSSKS